MSGARRAAYTGRYAGARPAFLPRAGIGPLADVPPASCRVSFVKRKGFGPQLENLRCQMTELNEGWYSDLSGHQILLRRLTEYPGANALGVLHDSKTDRVVIQLGPAVAGADEAQKAAKARVARLHALLKVAGLFMPDFNASEPFRVRPDGGRDLYASITENVYALDSISVEGGGAGAVQDVQQEKPYLVKLDELARSDEDVATVLRLLVVPDGETWTGLYRISEVIERAEGGWPKLVARGWTSRTQRERFRRTSNSMAAVGDGARHGSEEHEPPPNPMTLEEGRSYLLMLVQAWFADRLANFECSNT